MKRFFLLNMIIFILFTLLKTNYIYAENTVSTEDILEKQQSSFGIKDFLEEASKYSEDTFQDLSLTEVFENAITGDIDNTNLIEKIVNLFGKEIINTLKILVNIFIIVLLHSVLKSVTDSLENKEVSQIVYYAQYVLIVTIAMANFSEVLQYITDTIDNLVAFSQLLIPLLITLMIYTGSITTTSFVEPVILFLVEFIANLIKTLILPVISIITVLIIVSKINSKIQIEKLGKFMKSSIVWVLGIILTLFIGTLSLEGSLTASIDGVTAKTAKAAISNIIPVVGKILGDGVDSILGCAVILKNALGVVGVIIILGICILPIIKLASLSCMYSLASSILQPLAEENIVKLLDELGGIFKLLLAVLCTVSVLLIVGITLVVKISNSGMMYG